jgi:hypothetical protein
MSAVLPLSRISSGKQTEPDESPRKLLPAHELVAIGTLVILPIIGFGVSLVTNAYTPRFFLPATIGASLTVTISATVFMRSSHRTELLLLLFLGLGFAGFQAYEIRRLAGKSLPSKSVVKFLEQLPEQTLILSSPNQFLNAFAYTPPQLRARMGCLIDHDAVVRYHHRDSPHRSLQALSNFAAVPVHDYHSFVSENRHFYLLQNEPGWLHHELTQDGFELVRRKDIGRFVYEVTKR